MWLRSQNKLNLIDMSNKRVHIQDSRRGVSIYIDFASGTIQHDLCIDDYDSLWRAVEIVDQIQDSIACFEQDKNYNLVVGMTRQDQYRNLYLVYEMPEK